VGESKKTVSVEEAERWPENRGRKGRRRTLDADLADEGELATAASDADGEVALGNRPSAENGAVVGEVLVPQSEGDGLARSGREGGLLETTELTDRHLARGRLRPGDVELRGEVGQQEEGEK
jgi:hypothetical protein